MAGRLTASSTACTKAKSVVKATAPVIIKAPPKPMAKPSNDPFSVKGWNSILSVQSSLIVWRAAETPTLFFFCVFFSPRLVLNLHLHAFSIDTPGGTKGKENAKDLRTAARRMIAAARTAASRMRRWPAAADGGTCSRRSSTCMVEGPKSDINSESLRRWEKLLVACALRSGFFLQQSTLFVQTDLSPIA